MSFALQLGIGGREDLHGEQAGVGRARGADGERRHRDAFGHLHDGEQRVETLQRGRGDGHAEHRERPSCAAIMPGRCAAPPAPAMMTRRPRPRRSA
jgi:hypothetical protein